MLPITYTLFKKSSKYWKNALYLRHEVFVKEQGIPEAIELDELDESACHLIALHQQETCGVMRILLGTDCAKLGRIATHPNYRKQGIATGMINQAITFCHLVGVQTIALNSQTYITPFYEKLGFESEGEPFMEAGIPHIHMVLNLQAGEHGELHTEPPS